MAKVYSNIKLMSEPSDDNDVIKKKNLHEALWKEKTKQVVDVPEHYELASVQDGTVGLKIVDTISDATTEVLLTDVNAKILESDTHTYALGEYVELIAETYKNVPYEESIYLPRNEAPEENTLMTVEEFNEMWGAVKVKDYVES